MNNFIESRTQLVMKTAVSYDGLTFKSQHVYIAALECKDLHTLFRAWQMKPL